MMCTVHYNIINCVLWLRAVMLVISVTADVLLER